MITLSAFVLAALPKAVTHCALSASPFVRWPRHLFVGRIVGELLCRVLELRKKLKNPSKVQPRRGLQARNSGFILVTVVTTIVTMIVTMIALSSGHIEVTMVPMPVSVTDANSHRTDSNYDVFRDDHRFVAGAQGASKCWQG
jgi:Flp pilus assembly protein TadB